MTKWILIFLSVISIGLKDARPASVPLADAVSQKKVSVKVKTYSTPGNSGYYPSYFNQCMQFEVKNLTSVPLTLKELEGRFLVPDD